MNITEVNIKLVKRPATILENRDRLWAYCSIVLDGAVCIREMKVIEADGGALVVTMPSRMATDHCPDCEFKTRILDRYCSQCGAQLAESRVPAKGVVYYDVAHPISREARTAIVAAVMDAYADALERRDSLPPLRELVRQTA